LVLVLLSGCTRHARVEAIRPPPTAPLVPTPPTITPSTTAGALTPPPTTGPAPQRPFPISTMTLEMVDHSRATVSGDRTISESRALTTLVWYPTEGGPWPLVVFAHGFEVGPEPYEPLLRTWAEAGYVVAAPEFPLTDAEVAGDNLDEADIDNQPGDLAFVFSRLLDPVGALSGYVDPTRLGVAGHSDGAQTALATAAAPPVALGGVIVLAGAPVGSGPTGNPPILVAHGDADSIDPYERGEAVYEQASGPRFLLTLLGGEHLPPFTEGSEYQNVVDKTTIDFLDAYVGHTGPAAALLDDGRPRLATVDSAP